MLLRPKNSPETLADSDVPETNIPPEKTVVDFYADYYRYLFECTKDYISQTEASGQMLWDSFGENIQFVLSHPNGWGGSQQAKMREAFVRANLIPETSEGHDRISFVYEGEASLHYCLAGGLASDGVKVSLFHPCFTIRSWPLAEG
jgi:hypothetical protein